MGQKWESIGYRKPNLSTKYGKNLRIQAGYYTRNIVFNGAQEKHNTIQARERRKTK